MTKPSHYFCHHHSYVQSSSNDDQPLLQRLKLSSNCFQLALANKRQNRKRERVRERKRSMSFMCSVEKSQVGRFFRPSSFAGLEVS